MENNNFIITEMNITEDKINKKVWIINSFENRKKEEGWGDEEDDYKYKNEEEIKKCEIFINNKINPFSYYHTFDKKGKYHIKYLFSEYLTRTNFIFSECDYLTTIDFSNLNTQNVINMSYMFLGCNSLKTIDLSHFNTKNVTNMEYMFYDCNSLIYKIISNIKN